MNNKLKLKIGRVGNVVIVTPLNVPAWASDKNMLIKNNGYQISHSDYCEHILIGPQSLFIPNALFNDGYISCYEFNDSEVAEEWIDNIAIIVNKANAEYRDDDEIDDKILWDVIY